MHSYLTHEFKTKPALIRTTIDRHREWIESKLGNLAETIAFEVDLDLCQIGIERILACSSGRFSSTRAIRRLRPLVATAEVPEMPPLIQVSEAGSRISSNTQPIVEGQQRQSLSWKDCPVALKLYTVPSPIVIMNVPFHDGPSSHIESAATILIAKRECAEQVLFLLRDLSRRPKQPSLWTPHPTRCGPVGPSE